MDKKALTTIFIIILTDLIGFGLVIPILPQISESIGITGFRLGLIVCAYSLAQFFSAPYLGHLSDKFGRKPILVISKLGTVLAYLMLAFSHSFIPFFISRLIDGFTGGNISAARAYLSDITDKENRGKGMAIIGISFSLGFILGPAIGGIFYSIGKGLFLPAIVGAAMSLISAIFTIIFLNEPKKHLEHQNMGDFSVKKLFSVLDLPVLRSLFAYIFLFTIIMSGYQTTLSIFTGKTLNFNPQYNSYLFVYMGIVGLLFQVVIMKIKKPDMWKLTKIGTVIMALGVVLISQSTSLWMLLIGILVMSFGSGFVNVYGMTLISLNHGEHQEGKVMGVFESISSMARIIGPAILGSIIHLNVRAIYLVSGLLLLPLIYFLKPNQSQGQDPSHN